MAAMEYIEEALRCVATSESHDQMRTSQSQTGESTTGADVDSSVHESSENGDASRTPPNQQPSSAHDRSIFYNSLGECLRSMGRQKESLAHFHEVLFDFES